MTVSIETLAPSTLAFAKTSLGVMGSHGMIDLLSPHHALNSYNLDVNPVNEFMMKEIGAITLNLILIGSLQIFQGLDFQTSVGWSCLPYMFLMLSKLLNDSHKEIEILASPVYVILAINALVSYAAIQNLKQATKLIKAYGFFSAINGVVMYCSPKTALAAWKFPTTSQSLLQCFRIYGSLCLVHAIAVLFQSFELGTIVDAMGWGGLVCALTNLPNVKEFYEAENYKGVKMYVLVYLFWIVGAKVFISSWPF